MDGLHGLHGLLSWGANFRGFCGGFDLRIPVPMEWLYSVLIMIENDIGTNFEPQECVIFVQSTKIGTHENKLAQFLDAYIHK